MGIRNIGLEDTYSSSDYPKHCGKPLSPAPGDGIWECTAARCDRWVHFPQGLPPQVRGNDLEKAELVWNQFMS